jgi:hypothetical protein
MSLLQWPFKRKEYPGVGNPRFVSDIVAANEATIDAMKALTGLNNTDFAIITGLEFTPGTPNGTYAPGVFYLNGEFYYLGASFSEGLYLAPNPTDVMPKPFSDASSRLTYTLLSGISTSSPTGSTPIFSGNMNQYRIGIKTVNGNVLAMQAVIATLGNSAFRNVGTVGGTVAAGDDPRFGYTQSQIDTLFAKKADVILKGAGTAYTPTASTDPVNKQYADTAAGAKMVWLGQINSDGTNFTIAGSLLVTSARTGTGAYRISHNLGSTNFFCTGMGVDDVATLSSPRSFIIQNSNQFDVHVSDDASANDAAVQIAMWSYF